MTTNHPFDAETWAQLPEFLGHLPEPVHLHVWGDEQGGEAERETAVLCHTLAERFENIHFRQFPQRVNYPYYPVIGVMGADEQDVGVRLIGWPKGYQLTSLITAVQVVSFQGQTLEPLTRIKLRQLQQDVNIEVLTAADNEAGSLVAKIAFGLAVNHHRLRAFLIMADQFPQAAMRYSAAYLPHTVVNGRVHVEGVVDEETLLQHVATAVKA
ncbi:MAG: hypothetical protein ACE5EY_07925 [Anaerolineae bacterium]